MSSQAFDVDGPLGIDVDLSGGTVFVAASDAGVALVSVAPHDPGSEADRRAADQTTVTLEGTMLRIRGPRRRGVLSWLGPGPGPRIDVTIDVPPGSSLRSHGWCDLRTSGELDEVFIDAAMGNVVIDAASSVSVKSGMGDIRVGAASASADLVTSAGEISAGDIAGSARLKTSAGAIAVETVAGTAELRTAAGDIRVGTLRGSVSARTSAGEIRIARAEQGAARLDVPYGLIDIGVPTGTAVWLDAQAPHGRVDSALGDASGPADGDLVVELAARIGHGDVRLHRA